MEIPVTHPADESMTGARIHPQGPCRDGVFRARWALADPWPAFARMARQPFFFLEARPDGVFRAALRPVRVEVLRRGSDAAAFRRAWDRLAVAARPIVEAPSEAGNLCPIIGLLSFESGARFEYFRPRERIRRTFPEGILALYDLFFEWRDGVAHITSFGLVPDGREPERARRLAHALRASLRRAGMSSRPVPGGKITLAPPRGRYARSTAALRGEIIRGDLFQANLAAPFRVRLHARDEALAVFRRLIAASPAAHSAFLRLPKDALVSNSPELFLACDRTRDGSLRAHCLPIKGTALRHTDPVQDRIAAEMLVASEKDRAENRMIVDLMRNDFARVARVGSVVVPELFALNSLPNVHHLVSRIEATLSPRSGPADLIAACFPPGSVTGAPKPAALKAIVRHERQPRGAWCGTLFRTDGDACLRASVLIRSLALGWHPGRKFWRGTALAGAGITVLSDPVAETAEIHAKMRMIASAVREPFGMQARARPPSRKGCA